VCVCLIFTIMNYEIKHYFCVDASDIKDNINIFSFKSFYMQECNIINALVIIYLYQLIYFIYYLLFLLFFIIIF